MSNDPSLHRTRTRTTHHRGKGCVNVELQYTTPHKRDEEHIEWEGQSRKHCDCHRLQDSIKQLIVIGNDRKWQRYCVKLHTSPVPGNKECDNVYEEWSANSEAGRSSQNKRKQKRSEAIKDEFKLDKSDGKYVRRRLRVACKEVDQGMQCLLGGLVRKAYTIGSWSLQTTIDQQRNPCGRLENISIWYKLALSENKLHTASTNLIGLSRAQYLTQHTLQGKRPCGPFVRHNESHSRATCTLWPCSSLSAGRTIGKRELSVGQIFLRLQGGKDTAL